MPWMRATLTWMAMMLAETGHGVVREIFIAPVIGALPARQLGVLTGSLIVLAIAWLTARWVDARTSRAQYAVGALWVVLTILFEFSLGRATGMSWARLLGDYDPARGGFLLLGLAVMFLAPRIASARLTRRRG
jgi:hypothetical protein